MGVGLGVRVGVAVGVHVGVAVGDGVGLGMGEGVGVSVEVGVDVSSGVAVGDDFSMRFWATVVTASDTGIGVGGASLQPAKRIAIPKATTRKLSFQVLRCNRMHLLSPL